MNPKLCGWSTDCRRTVCLEYWLSQECVVWVLVVPRSVRMEFLFSQEYLVRILVVKRIVWLEYWLTQDSVVVVLFQHRTVWLENWLTLGCMVGVQVDTGLCGGVLVRPRTVRWEYCLNPRLCAWNSGWTKDCDVMVLVGQKSVQMYTGLCGRSTDCF